MFRFGINARIKKGWEFQNLTHNINQLFFLNVLNVFFGFHPQFFEVSLFLPIPFLLDTSKFNQKLKQKRGKKT